MIPLLAHFVQIEFAENVLFIYIIRANIYTICAGIQALFQALFGYDYHTFVEKMLNSRHIFSSFGHIFSSFDTFFQDLGTFFQVLDTFFQVWTHFFKFLTHFFKFAYLGLKSWNKLCHSR